MTILFVLAGLLSCGARPGAGAGAAGELPTPAAELLRYRNDSVTPFEPGGMFLTDTNHVYDEIESYPMLRAVLLDARAEEAVLPYAIERALLVAGPGRVFADVRRDAARRPELFAGGARRELVRRADEPHVWVGGSAFIEGAKIPRAEARTIFERMVAEVRAGEPFDDVYSRTQKAHVYRDGPMRLTRVGNYGDWVVSAGKRTGAPFRSGAAVPERHVERLLAARAGDLLVLEHDDADGGWLILYSVREVYRPGAEGGGRM